MSRFLIFLVVAGSLAAQDAQGFQIAWENRRDTGGTLGWSRDGKIALWEEGDYSPNTDEPIGNGPAFRIRIINLVTDEVLWNSRFPGWDEDGGPTWENLKADFLREAQRHRILPETRRQPVFDKYQDPPPEPSREPPSFYFGSGEGDGYEYIDMQRRLVVRFQIRSMGTGESQQWQVVGVSGGRERIHGRFSHREYGWIEPHSLKIYVSPYEPRVALVFHGQKRLSPGSETPVQEMVRYNAGWALFMQLVVGANISWVTPSETIEER